MNIYIHFSRNPRNKESRKRTL